MLAKNKMIQNKGIYKRLSLHTICEWLFIILRCMSDAIIEAFDLEKSTFFNWSIWLFQFGWDDIITRYEIDWIGREGLACETHDEFLRVSAKSKIIIIRTIRGQSFCVHIFHFHKHHNHNYSMIPRWIFRTLSTISTRMSSSLSVSLDTIVFLIKLKT